MAGKSKATNSLAKHDCINYQHEEQPGNFEFQGDSVKMHQRMDVQCANKDVSGMNDSICTDGLSDSQTSEHSKQAMDGTFKHTDQNGDADCTLNLLLSPEKELEASKKTVSTTKDGGKSLELKPSERSNVVLAEEDESAGAFIGPAPRPCSSAEKSDENGGISDEQECNYFEDMRSFEKSADNQSQLIKGPMVWIMKQISQDINPRNVISQIMPGVAIPRVVDPMTLWKVVWEILTEPKPRQKLDQVSTLDDVVGLIARSKNIIVLTGAGVSVSCGIPDFRSRDGIYARLSKDFPDLPDPQSMFDIHHFRRDQRPFYKFAKEIYPGQFKPSLSHRFIAALDNKKILLRNYTQNIDTLEQVAGIERVVQCHGSFATASCTNCKYQVSSEEIRDNIFAQVTPKCPICPENENVLSVMKPDIIFFGEGLPDVFYQKLDTDKTEADLLIVIGSSLKVRPVALIPDYLKPGVPQVLINREPLNHFNFDVELLGNCDAVICELCQRLGDDWTNVVNGYDMPALDKEAMYKLFDSMSDTNNDESMEDSSTSVSMETDQVENEEDVNRLINSIQDDTSSGSSFESASGGTFRIAEEAISQSSTKYVDNRVSGQIAIESNESNTDCNVISKYDAGNTAESCVMGSVGAGNTAESCVIGSVGAGNTAESCLIGSVGAGELGIVKANTETNTEKLSLRNLVEDGNDNYLKQNEAGYDIAASKIEEGVVFNEGLGDLPGKIQSDRKLINEKAPCENADDAGKVKTEMDSEVILTDKTGDEKPNERKRAHNAITGTFENTTNVEQEVRQNSCQSGDGVTVEIVGQLIGVADSSDVSRLDTSSNAAHIKDPHPKRLKLDPSFSAQDADHFETSLGEKDLKSNERTEVTHSCPSTTSSDKQKQQSSRHEETNENTTLATAKDVAVLPKSPTFSKDFLLKEMEEQGLIYLYVPPNRYIFHGAEINSSFMIQQRRFDLGSDEELEDEENAEEEDAEENAEEHEENAGEHEEKHEETAEGHDEKHEENAEGCKEHTEGHEQKTEEDIEKCAEKHEKKHEETAEGHGEKRAENAEGRKEHTKENEEHGKPTGERTEEKQQSAEEE